MPAWRVAEVWPEFAAHGKECVTLRQILLHTAGVCTPPYGTTAADLGDWERLCAALADSAPWWPPGTRFGYHAQIFGFLPRRPTGRSRPASAPTRPWPTAGTS